MSAEKYPSIFSRQMATIVYLNLVFSGTKFNSETQYPLLELFIFKVALHVNAQKKCSRFLNRQSKFCGPSQLPTTAEYRFVV